MAKKNYKQATANSKYIPYDAGPSGQHKSPFSYQLCLPEYNQAFIEVCRRVKLEVFNKEIFHPVNIDQYFLQ